MTDRPKAPNESIDVILPRYLVLEALEAMRIRIKVSEDQKALDNPDKLASFNELVKSYLQLLEILEKVDKDFERKLASAI